MDKHDCYEACVQAPLETVRFLQQAHGGTPTQLGEDFCGSAAVSRVWTEVVPNSSAIGVDADRSAIEAGRARVSADGRVRLLHEDVRTCNESVDVLYVGNFSIGELHSRHDLLGYLRHARSRLGTSGVWVCDTYRATPSDSEHAIHRFHAHSDPVLGTVQIRYTWEQREYDSRTQRVVNACHFRVQRAGEILLELDDAFVYRWQLWSESELPDVLAEAGFLSVEVRPKSDDGIDTSWVIARV